MCVIPYTCHIYGIDSPAHVRRIRWDVSYVICTVRAATAVSIDIVKNLSREKQGFLFYFYLIHLIHFKQREVSEWGLDDGLVWPDRDEVCAEVDFASGDICMQCIGHVDWSMMEEQKSASGMARGAIA